MVSQMSQESLAFSLGADDYLTKPIERNKFLKIVKKFVSSDSKNNTILIVDDDENTRDILSRALEDTGFKAITAKDGKEGLKNLETNIDPEYVDLELPKGFVLLAESEKNIDPDITQISPIFICSGII